MKKLFLDLLPISLIFFIKKFYYILYGEKKLRDQYLNINIELNALDNIGEIWKTRINKVISSPDNVKIPRSKEAGKLENNIITMHNDLKVYASSFYDLGNAKILVDNKGIHEPDEQFLFQEVLKKISTGGTMLELGAYWGFYSLWFANEIDNAKCFLVEPLFEFMIAGKLNFELNNLQAKFFNNWVGKGNKYSSLNYVKSISVDEFMEENKIGFLNILHSDIQGGEVNMLHNAKNTLNEKKIEYLFISTHSVDIHKECEYILKQFNYNIIHSCDINSSYSPDGVLVAKKNESNN